MTYQELKQLVLSKNFVFFDGPQLYNVNFVWERTSLVFTNMFTDSLHIGYMDENGEQCITLKATTKAALYGQGGVLNPVPGGTAVIKEGQYRSSWSFGMGNGTGILPWGAPYFQQVRGINYWRDANEDATVDEVNEQDNQLFGTNWHIMAEPLSVNIPGHLPWSEGCCGCSQSDMINIITPLMQKVIPIWGPLVTGTIIETQPIA